MNTLTKLKEELAKAKKEIKLKRDYEEGKYLQPSDSIRIAEMTAGDFIELQAKVNTLNFCIEELEKDKRESLKSNKEYISYGKRGASDSVISSELLDKEHKKLLILNILREIYGSKYVLIFKRKEPYFYNAISEAIILAYKRGIEEIIQSLGNPSQQPLKTSCKNARNTKPIRQVYQLWTLDGKEWK
jgi:hypothetical protein